MFACSDELQCHVIEVNTSQRLSKSNVMVTLGEATQSHRLSFGRSTKTQGPEVLKAKSKTKAKRKPLLKKGARTPLGHERGGTILLWDDVCSLGDDGDIGRCQWLFTPLSNAD